METPWANNHKGAGLLRCELVLHGKYAGGVNIGDQEQEFLHGSTRPQHAAVDYSLESPSRLFSQPSSRSVASGVVGYRRLRRPRMTRFCPTVVPSWSGTMHFTSYDCDPSDFLPISEPGS